MSCNHNTKPKKAKVNATVLNGLGCGDNMVNITLGSLVYAYRRLLKVFLRHNCKHSRSPLKFFCTWLLTLKNNVRVLELKIFQFRKKKQKCNTDFLLISLFAKRVCTDTLRRKM